VLLGTTTMMTKREVMKANLRKWTGAAGYNHNDDQAGSDEG